MGPRLRDPEGLEVTERPQLCGERLFIQRLFEKLADYSSGNVALERWYKDNSARIRYRCFTGEAVFRVRMQANESGIPLVSITHRGLQFLISPIPSVIVGALMR